MGEADVRVHTNDFFLFVPRPIHLCLGVNPYCTGEIDFPIAKKSAAPTDRQPYSLCSNRKSLSQQLDYPVSVRRRGGAWRRGRTGGSVMALVLFCSQTAESLLSLLRHPARQKSFGRTVCQVSLGPGTCNHCYFYAVRSPLRTSSPLHCPHRVLNV